MNATDLHRLVGRPRNHGLRVVALDPELRLRVTNPLNGLLTQEIVAEGGRYVTSFLREIGERGREKKCADRIAHMLAVSMPTPPGVS